MLLGLTQFIIVGIATVLFLCVIFNDWQFVKRIFDIGLGTIYGWKILVARYDEKRQDILFHITLPLVFFFVITLPLILIVLPSRISDNIFTWYIYEIITISYYYFLSLRYKSE